jgi:hypothetical protein
MNLESVIRWVILVVATAAMIVGVAVMAGWLVPAALPDQFRIPMGAVVFLYGAYRFMIAFYRNAGSRSNGDR